MHAKRRNISFSKFQILLISLAALFVFILVFSPRIGNPFPAHIDEWHHIEETFALKNGSYTGGVFTYEIGFHVFLAGISYLFDLIMIYRFLPAILAVISSIVLFFLVYNLTNKKFSISLISMIFFGMLHSSQNLLGINFFTPLSFSIPFIFLFVYWFIFGLQREKKVYITISVIIMIFLIPIYSLSVLAFIPLIFIMLIVYRKFVKKEYKFFLMLLLIPFAGLFFYFCVWNLPLSQAVPKLLNELTFDAGWKEYVQSNSLTEIYSLVGYFFAVIGFLSIIIKKEKKFYPFLIWPACMLVWIFIFRLFEINFLSPYQRNFYFLVIGLPLISSLGFENFFNWIKEFFSKKSKQKEKMLSAILIIFIILILLFAVKDAESAIKYREKKFITWGDYDDLIYLSSLPKGIVLSSLDVAEALKPISGQEPAVKLGFYKKENAIDVTNFFESDVCENKDKIIQKLNVKYIISPINISCNYKLLSSTNNFIYEIEEVT
jgi:hypothetical protein